MANNTGRQEAGIPDFPDVPNTGENKVPAGYDPDEAGEMIRSGPNDARWDAFENIPAPIIVDPDDGIPRPMDPDHGDEIPELSEDTFVCIEDRRSFVEILFDQTRTVGLQTIPGGAVIRVNERNRWDTSGDPVTPFVFTPDEVVEKCGVLLGRYANWNPSECVRVRPVRPQCEHYASYISHSDIVTDNGKARVMERWCHKFRTVAGAQMNLTDSAMLACSSRSPEDPAGLAAIREFDRVIIDKGRPGVRHRLPLLKPNDPPADPKKKDQP
jgi:hypothetical protein